MRRLTMPLALLLLFTGCGDDSIESTVTSALATETTTTMLSPDTVVAETTVAPTTTEPIVEPSGPIRVTEPGDIGVGPFDAIASPEGYWVVDEGGNALHRVDATSGHVLHYPMGDLLSVSDFSWGPDAWHSAAGFGAVWMLSGGQLLRMDVTGRIDNIALPGYGWGLGIGPSAVWVATVIGEPETEDCHENCEPQRLAISRIINDGLELTATLELPIGDFQPMVFLPDSVWFLWYLDSGQPLLLRVDETGSELESWPIEAEFVWAMETAHGFVWLGIDPSGLLRVDPLSGDQVPLAAGVAEEALFRGVAQTALAGALGQGTALAATSALFGLAHPVSALYMLFVGALGAYLGGLFIATGNLLVPIVVHAAYDFVGLKLLLRASSRDGDRIG